VAIIRFTENKVTRMSKERLWSGQDRRSFLKQIAVTGGAWIVGGCRGAGAQPAPGTASAASPERIGVQLYTVRDQMEKDFAGTLERVARIGFGEVEFAGYFDHEPGEVRSLLDRLGLRAPSAHVSLEELRRDLPGQLRTARIVGNQYITVPALSEVFRGETMDLDFWRRTADEFNRLGRATREQGIGFAYHNHWFEFDRLADGRTGWDVLVSEPDPALVSFELDLLWATFAGQDPVQLFQRSPGRYVMWHVKDMRDLQEARRLAADSSNLGEFMRATMSRLAPVDTGEIDFRRIFAHAREAGMRHYFVENDAAPTSGSSLADIETSYQNLRQLLG
jgi:sugar phosphate isomerase/epimerase